MVSKTGFDSRACDQMKATIKPSRKFTRPLGLYDFEPAVFTTEYPPGHSGGLTFFELLAGAACMGEWVARSRATGRVVGGVTDSGTPGKARWSFQRLRPARRAYRERSNQLDSWLTVAPSFPALMELIA
jgi:hypothetical protein